MGGKIAVDGARGNRFLSGFYYTLDNNLEAWDLSEENNHILATEKGSRGRLVVADMEKRIWDHRGINCTINSDKTVASTVALLETILNESLREVVRNNKSRDILYTFTDSILSMTVIGIAPLGDGNALFSVRYPSVFDFGTDVFAVPVPLAVQMYRCC